MTNPTPQNVQYMMMLTAKLVSLPVGPVLCQIPWALQAPLTFRQKAKAAR